MTYATLTQRLAETTPNEFTPESTSQLELAKAQVKSALEVISLYVNGPPILQTLGVIRQSIEIFPLVTDTGRFDHIDTSVQKAMKSFEDGVVRMRGLGAVKQAEYYANIYRVIPLGISEI